MCREEGPSALRRFLDAREIHFVSFSLFPGRIRSRGRAIRLHLTPIALVLCCCASPSTSERELSSLRAEIRSLRDENTRLAGRVERLETTLPATASSASAPQPAASREVPSLTVVKLKPKSDPAPKLSVSVPVVEPEGEALAEIVEPTQASPGQSTARAGDPALDAEFADALAALRTGNVAGGIARLQRFAAQNPRHPKADNALYYVGVGLMAQSDFEGAAGTFERLLSSYPASDEGQSALLKLAECRVRLKNAGAARAVYTQLVTKYPGSVAAVEATQRLAALPP